MIKSLQTILELNLSAMIKENRQNYFKEVIGNLDEYSYRSKRYNIHFALAVVYCSKDINLNEIVDVKRKTDRLISLNKNLCFVIFDCIDADSSQKAMQNLQTELQERCLENEFFLKVTTSMEYESASKMTNYLFDLLEEFTYNLEIKNKLSSID